MSGRGRKNKRRRKETIQDINKKDGEHEKKKFKKVNDKNDESVGMDFEASKKANHKKEHKTEKTNFLPEYRSSFEEIYAMFSVYSYDKREMKESLDVSAKNDNSPNVLAEKQDKDGNNSDSSAEKEGKCAVGEETFNTFDKTDVFSIEEINFPEIRSGMCNTYDSAVEKSMINFPEIRSGMCNTYDSAVEKSMPTFSVASYGVVDPSPTVDVSTLEENSESDIPCNMDTDMPYNMDTDKCLFNADAGNTLEKVISQMGDWISLIEKPASSNVEINRKRPLSVSEEFPQVPKENENIVIPSKETESGVKDKVLTEEGIDEIVRDEENEDKNDIDGDKTGKCERDKEYREKESQRNMEEGMREEEITEVRKGNCLIENKCLGEEECANKEERRGEEEHKRTEKEVEEFEELSKKLDEYISSVLIPDNFDDGEIFIPITKKLLDVKSSHDKKNSAGLLSEVENSSYPEFIHVVREMLSVSMKKIYEFALASRMKHIQEEMINETVNTDNINLFLEEIIKCCDDYFVFFLKSIMTDSLVCDSLFKAVVKHLKRSISSFTKIHPFLLLVIFSNYPKANCLMLCKFLNICKVLFSVNFNYSYSLPYLQNLKRFLIFSMLEVYHDTDVNGTHYLFRKEAARFYSNIIEKYYPEQEKNVISYLKRILMNKKSKFCSCYGALCAIRAMGSLVEAEVIPEIFPLMVIKLKSVKRFTQEILETFSVKDHKEVNHFELNSAIHKEVDHFELNSDVQLFPSVNQTEFVTGQSTSKSESELHELTLYKYLPHTDSAAQDKSYSSEKSFVFDTRVPSENIYSSLIREELLNACSELTNEYINNLVSVRETYLFPFTSNSVSSNTVKMFLDYFRQELRDLIPLKYAYKTFPLHCDIFTKKLMLDLKFREKSRFLFY